MKKILNCMTMVAAIVFVLVSCDTDPNELGGDFLGVDIDNRIVGEEFEVTAFSTRLNPVQTNNAPSVLLGTYSDPVYGKSTYDLVSQISIPFANPDFGRFQQIDSVVLTIPYFSRQVGIDGEEVLYELDSIYGNGNVTIEAFENGFFLSSFDQENVSENAVYFSDQEELISSNVQGDKIFTIENFEPDDSEVLLFDADNDTIPRERLSPRYRQLLDTDFWQQKIIDQEDTENLSSDSNFQNFFRGIYFNVASDSGDGLLAGLNLSQADITIYYQTEIQDLNDADNDDDTNEFIPLNSSYRLSFAGNRAFFIDNEFTPEVETAIENSENPEVGSDRLYLKGGEGAITFIDLFGPDLDNDGEADALTDLMERDILVNEARLDLFVDQSAVAGGESEPERIVIYNAETGAFLADFQLSGSGSAINSNTVHLGRLEREGDDGVRYRIRLTQHVTNILNGLRENTRLALAVSQNVNLVGQADVKNPEPPFNIENVQINSVVAHEGTVLHGNLSSDPDKRLKLELFITEVDN
jgi:hypothetical protein